MALVMGLMSEYYMLEAIMNNFVNYVALIRTKKQKRELTSSIAFYLLDFQLHLSYTLGGT